MRTYSAFDFNDVHVFINHKEYDRAYDLLIEIHEYGKNILLYESPYILFYIGICQANLGNLYLAIEWLSRAKKLDPLNHEIASFHSNLLIDIEASIEELIPYGLEKKLEVEKVFSYLIEKGQVRSALQFNMIRFYIMINEIDLAKVMLDNFLERNPNDEEAKFMHSSLNTFAIKHVKTDKRPKSKSA